MKYIKCSFNGSLRSTVKLKLCSSQAWKKNKDDRHEFQVLRSEGKWSLTEH